MNKEIEEWYQKMWITKAARFNAYRRVRNKHNWTSLSVIFLSVYIVAINLMVFMEEFRDSKTSILITIITIILSVLVFGLTIYLNMRSYKLEYTSHHEIGKQLANTYNKIVLMKNNNNQFFDLDSLVFDYQRIIDNSVYNHEPVDYKRAMIEEGGYNYWFKCYIKIQYGIVPILLPLLSIFLPLFFLTGWLFNKIML